VCRTFSEFCCSEKGELLTMRLKILCEDRCEDIAVNLAAACVRSLRRSDQLRSLSESHHVHYMIDVYIVLLYKLKRTQDIFAQVSTDRISHNRIIKCPVARSLAASGVMRIVAECVNRFAAFVILFFKSRFHLFDSIPRGISAAIYRKRHIENIKLQIVQISYVLVSRISYLDDISTCLTFEATN